MANVRHSVPGRTRAAPREGPRARFAEIVAHLGRSTWFSYATIFLLQLHALWGIWNSPRLGFGDTSWYFAQAVRLAEHGEVTSIAMSPLYGAYYAAAYLLTGEPYSATWLHRVVLALAVAMAALALFRSLLPHGLAWALAAWWSVSPVIFDTKYEVHLFAVLPVLIAARIAAGKDSPWRRGSALAILAGAGLVVRNELLVAAALFGIGCALWERSQRSGALTSSTYAAAYLLPLAIAMSIPAVFYAGVPARIDLREAMDYRHRLSMAQVYAFGFGQRDASWKKSPWTEYHELLTRDFANPRPSMTEMLRTNPRATFEHFLWNVRLIPAGLQQLLFGEVSGRLNPDFEPPPMHSARARLLSIIVAALGLAGSVALVRKRQRLWEHHIRPHASGWMLLLAVAAVAPLIILAVRPRPSYLFGLRAFLTAYGGLCIVALTETRRWTPALRKSWPLVALATAAVVPQLMTDYPPNRTPLFDHVDRLWPHRRELSAPAEKLGSLAWSPLLQRYVGQPPDGFDVDAPLPTADDVDVLKFLDSHQLTGIYLEELWLARLEAQPGAQRPFVDFIPEPWRLVDSGDRWRLYHREYSR